MNALCIATLIGKHLIFLKPLEIGEVRAGEIAIPKFFLKKSGCSDALVIPVPRRQRQADT